MQGYRVGTGEVIFPGAVVPAACIGAWASVCQSACDIVANCSEAGGDPTLCRRMGSLVRECTRRGCLCLPPD
jgi:hypothetical protein